jgi:hypothetical protein
MSDTVRIYDPKTKSVSEIPAAELAPGYVRVHRQGVGEVFMKVDEIIMPDVLRHAPFSLEVRKIFRRLKKALDEVRPRTMEAWEVGFRKDQNPGPQILAWVRTAQAYEKCLRTLKPRDLTSRKGFLQVIQSYAVNGEHALNILNVPAESRTVALMIVEICMAPLDERETAEMQRTTKILNAYFGSEQKG